MVHTEIKIGAVCNNRCIFCLNDRSDWQKSTQQIKREIIEAKNAGVDEVNFTGGEFTIRRDLFELLDFTKSQGLRINIQTNGRAFYYREFAENVCSYGVSSFLVSFHAHTPSLYKELCGVDGYAQVRRGIKNLLKLNQIVFINCVLSKKNIDYVRDIAKHHAGLGVNNLQFGWVRGTGRAKEMFDEIVPDFKGNIEKLLKALDWLDKNFKGSVHTLGIPFCILGKYSFFKGLEYIDQVIVRESKKCKLAGDYVVQGKVKPPACSKCIYCHRCEGLHSEYAERFGTEELNPVDELFNSVLGVVGFFPQEQADDIPNYGAFRVTNELLLNIQKSQKVDKVIYFLRGKGVSRFRHLQSNRIKILPLSALDTFSRMHEDDIAAMYCIYRDTMKLLENYRFKKIALIHSQDTPDILETYGRYVFEYRKNNCLFVSPSQVGKDIALNIFKEFENVKGSTFNHRIEVIPWGTDMVSIPEIQVKKDTVRLLYLGRLDSRYKVDLIPLFEVFRKLKRDFPGITLDLVGEMRPYEKERLTPFMNSSIVYHGEIEERDKMLFIAQRDILVSPVNSIQETFGVTLLEAASQGLVCIGTDWNGYNEILRKENLINTDVIHPDVHIPVGREYCSAYIDISRNISKHIKIDWDDCYQKLKNSIVHVMAGRKADSLKCDVNDYLWSGIVAKHEALWDSPDSHESDVVKSFPEGLTIPAKIFFKPSTRTDWSGYCYD